MHTHSRNRLLWQCLISLLADPRYRDIIRWTNPNGTFELIDRHAVAELWAQYSTRSAQRSTQTRKEMTESQAQTVATESLLRSIRYYKTGGINGAPIIEKAQGHFRFRFITPIVELTGYTVEELDRFNADYDMIEPIETAVPIAIMKPNPLGEIKVEETQFEGEVEMFLDNSR